MRFLPSLLVALVVIGTGGAAFSQPPSDRPFVVSSTYWGGSSVESFAAVAVDGSGNVYVAGATASADFPKTVTALPALGSTEAYLTKFDADGRVVFSTVFGGSAAEQVKALAVDAAGNIIVVGDTTSADLPVVNPIQPAFHPAICGEFGSICPDGFVAKIDPTGQHFVFSTYLGDTGLDRVIDVALDGNGDVYVVGTSDSPAFEGAAPIRPFAGTQDAFVARIPSAGGALAYFTYLGGTFFESGGGIAADMAGNAYVTGTTGSDNFPTQNPIQATRANFSDYAFVTKLDPAGVIAYSTYLGGHARDAGFAVAVDPAGRAHVAGTTASTDFPVVNAAQPFLRGSNDVFLAKLGAAGSSLEYSTYLGGNDREELILDLPPGLGVSLDPDGYVYVSGVTQSGDFPAFYPLQEFGGGACLIIPVGLGPCPDGFLSKLDADGGLVFSTPIGGDDDDRARGVAVRPDGVAYVVGTTRSDDFPVEAAVQPALAGVTDAFIVKISTAPPACQLPAPVPLSPTGGVFEPRPTFSWEPVAGADAYAVLAVDVAHAVLTGTPPLQLLESTEDTAFRPNAPLAARDYYWQVAGWNATCGFGRWSPPTTFTLPGTCPVPTPVQTSPVGGVTVDNPTRLGWSLEGSSIAALSVVVVYRADGRFIGQYPTLHNTFTIPTTLSTGDYVWFVLAWNSTCGTTVSGPAYFRSSGQQMP